MIQHSNGFILLLTLVSILVISLLVLTGMQHVLLYYKAINQLEVQHQNFYQLEAIALQLARLKSSQISSQCMIKEDWANWFFHNSNSQGCAFTLAKVHYNYRIEDLGDFPCLVVWQDHNKYATRHHRISVVAHFEGKPESLLQIRYLTPIPIQECMEREQEVDAGISSWRYIPSLTIY